MNTVEYPPPPPKRPPPVGDLGGKRLVGLDPDAWLRLVTGRPHIRCVEQLEGGFQWVGRDTDILLKAYDPEIGYFLVLIELQLRPDPRMPRRVEAYSALAEEKFGLPVFAVVINILAEGGVVADRYESEILGFRAERRYRVICLRDLNARQVLAGRLTGLLPFLPIMQGGGDRQLLGRAVAMLRRSPQLSGLESLLAYMARHVMTVEQIMELMRWDIAVLRESPWYQDILSEGIEQGIEQGVERGQRQGAHDAALRQLLRVLSHRFGPASPGIEARLAAMDTARLEALTDVALDVADLADVLRQVDTAEPEA